MAFVAGSVAERAKNGYTSSKERKRPSLTAIGAAGMAGMAVSASHLAQCLIDEVESSGSGLRRGLSSAHGDTEERVRKERRRGSRICREGRDTMELSGEHTILTAKAGRDATECNTRDAVMRLQTMQTTL